MKLAMLQILRLAPSIRPDIELVVSSANTTSTWGRLAWTATAGVGFSGVPVAVAGGVAKLPPSGSSSNEMVLPGATRRAPSATSTVNAAAATMEQVILLLPLVLFAISVVSVVGVCM